MFQVGGGPSCADAGCGEGRRNEIGWAGVSVSFPPNAAVIACPVPLNTVWTALPVVRGMVLLLAASLALFLLPVVAVLALIGWWQMKGRHIFRR